MVVLLLIIFSGLPGILWSVSPQLSRSALVFSWASTLSSSEHVANQVCVNGLVLVPSIHHNALSSLPCEFDPFCLLIWLVGFSNLLFAGEPRVGGDLSSAKFIESGRVCGARCEIAIGLTSTFFRVMECSSSSLRDTAHSFECRV